MNAADPVVLYDAGKAALSVSEAVETCVSVTYGCNHNGVMEPTQPRRSHVIIMCGVGRRLLQPAQGDVT